MNLADIYSKLFRPRPLIEDIDSLSDFIDQQTAFIVQKGIYEYSRARAGHYAKVLFGEEAFLQAAEQSSWRAYPLGLAMVGEVVDAALRPHSEQERPTLAPLTALVLSVFDRHPTPAALTEDVWRDARGELVRRLNFIGLHPPKRVMDIPEPFAQHYFDLMPIHKKLRGSDFPAIKSYLKVTLCNVHDELTKRMDARALADALHARAS